MTVRSGNVVLLCSLLLSFVVSALYITFNFNQSGFKFVVKERQTGLSLSLAYDKNCSICKLGGWDKVHIITNLFVPTDPQHMKQLESYSPVNIDRELGKGLSPFEARLLELVYSLQMNLNHERVDAIHILYNKQSTYDTLDILELKNKWKLVMHKVDVDPTFKTSLRYISRYLINKTVVVNHGDVYLGDGWHKINPYVLRDNHLMYALTRHQNSSQPCPVDDKCGPSAHYIGSHDTFVFSLSKPVPKSFLNFADVRPDIYGFENVVIWFFREYLNYKVTNPCRVLFTYHLHCIQLHNKDRIERPRVNKKSTTGMAPFTDSLL